MLLMWVVLALSAQGRVHLTDTNPSYAMRERTSSGGTRSHIQAGGHIDLNAPKGRNQNSTIAGDGGDAPSTERVTRSGLFPGMTEAEPAANATANTDGTTTGTAPPETDAAGNTETGETGTTGGTGEMGAGTGETGTGTIGTGAAGGSGTTGSGSIGGVTPAQITTSMAAQAALGIQSKVAQTIGANRQLHDTALAQAEARAAAAAEAAALKARQIETRILADGTLFGGDPNAYYGIKYGTGVLGGILEPLPSLHDIVISRSNFYASEEGGGGAFFEQQREWFKNYRYVKEVEGNPLLKIGKDNKAKLANAQLVVQGYWDYQRDLSHV